MSELLDFFQNSIFPIKASFEQSLLEQLHDIEGLDPISWWPLALGWWIVLFGCLILLALILAYVISKISFERCWKKDALTKLSYLENKLSDDSIIEVLTTLSQYLRRIALKRYSRKECATLMGEDWLKWLSAHDPKNFNWEAEGTLFLDIAYAPKSLTISLDKAKELIHAVRNWVY